MNAIAGVALQSPLLGAALKIEIPSLIAQVIIFIVVFWVLSKFAFVPVSRLLETRRQRIIEAEANFAKSREVVAGADADAKAILTRAGEQADQLIKEAQQAAADAGERKRQETIAEGAAIIAKAREASRIEQAKAMADLKRDFGRLVIDATGKVTGKILTAEDRETLNQEAAAQIAR